MAAYSYKVSTTGPTISKFDLPKSRTIKLYLGKRDTKTKLDVISSAPRELEVSSVSDGRSLTTFSVRVKGAAKTASVAGYEKGSRPPKKCTQDLAVRLCGTPHHHPAYDVDLLANLAVSGNAKQIHTYTRILLGPGDKTSMLSQDTRPGHYNCGDVAAAYGWKYFSKPTSTTYRTPYYKTTTSDKMADLRFRDKEVENGIKRIKALLGKGTSVRLWVIHHDGFEVGRRITGTWRTHFVTVIGHSTALSKFLYLDPWPQGSVLEYNGGMYGKTKHHFLGELTFDAANLTKGISSPPGSKGIHTYYVIAGP